MSLYVLLLLSVLGLGFIKTNTVEFTTAADVKWWIQKWFEVYEDKAKYFIRDVPFFYNREPPGFNLFAVARTVCHFIDESEQVKPASIVGLNSRTTH